MPDNWMVAGYAGLIAVGGIIAACWRQVLSFWSQLSGRMIVRVEFDGYGLDALRLYARDHWQRSRFSGLSYLIMMLYVRPMRRHQLIVLEDQVIASGLFWKGWSPIWVNAPKGSDTAPNGHSSTNTTVSFIRGTIDPDTFALEMTEYYNRTHLTANGVATRRHVESVRHNVEHFYGSASQMEFHGLRVAHVGDVPTGRQEPSAAAKYQTMRLLKWRHSEVGAGASGDRNRAIENLALPPEAESIREEIERWLDSEAWYHERGLPWRRNYLLHGGPGVGKTSLVRAIAEAYDLPVHVFDLASHRNSELQRNWTKMLGNAPCIGLLEDLDNIFNGRENVANKESGLTYDCLLNCIDGIERANGLLLFITTNRIELLDPALGAPNEHGDSSRPGRVDRIVKLGPLAEPGRLKLAKRILKDWPAEWSSAVEATEGFSGAQVQESLTRRAQELFWDRSAVDARLVYSANGSVAS